MTKQDFHNSHIKYYGTSSEIKPTISVPTGSTWLESDIGDKYEFNGSDWVLSQESTFYHLFSTYMENFSERVTSAVRSIDTEHAYIHSGIMFSTYKSISMTAGGTSKIQLTTPADKYIHWRPTNISTKGDNVTVTLYEDCTPVTAGGTVTIANRNRISTTTSQMTILTSAAITNNGTAIDAAYIGGGSGVGGARSGSETGEKNEIILKQSEDYCLVVENGSTAANTIFIKLQWYEEADA